MARNRSTIAYWIGVVMAGACVAFVLAHHASLPVSMEFGGISLVWLTGGAAILSILIHELINSVAEGPRGINARKPETVVRTGVPPDGEAHNLPAVTNGEGADPAVSGSEHRAA